MGIAEAAVAALQEHAPLSGGGQVGQHVFLVLAEDLGADGYAQHHVIAAATGAVAPRAVLAGITFEMLLIAEIDQGVEIGDTFDDHVAALAAITAVGAAIFDEFLAPEAAGSRAAVATRQEEFGLIEKLHRESPKKEGEWIVHSPS
jgi:hypothetical protein